MNTSRYLASRIGQAVVVLWAAFTVTFILLEALPGDALFIKFQNPDLGLSPQQIVDIRAAYGADQSLVVQYIHALGRALTGNFGYSVVSGVPVPDKTIAAKPGVMLPVMLNLAVAAPGGTHDEQRRAGERRLDRPARVNRVADDIDNSAQGAFAHWRLNHFSGVGDFLAANQTFR